jgi:hypothetical protein
MGNFLYQRISQSNESIRYVQRELTQSTIVDVTRNEHHWEGTSRVRPYHIPSVENITPVYVPRLDVQLKAAPTMDEKINVLRKAPTWQKVCDLHVSRLGNTRPTSEQCAKLREVLNREQYQELAIMYMESDATCTHALSHTEKGSHTNDSNGN